MDKHLLKYLHGKTLSTSLWWVGMLLSPRTENIAATFNFNPSIIIIFCYSRTNVSNETDLITFYNELSSLVRCIPKHYVLIIGGDTNAQTGEDENNKFCLHNSLNRNSEHLKEFSLKNGLTCLNIKFQKKKGKLWIYTYANNAKTQMDYSLMNKKWINSALNREAVVSGCEWVPVCILRVLLLGLIPTQIQHKFYKHVNKWNMPTTNIKKQTI